ncbi:MAG: glucosyltransferase domain-containing protein [Lachnospiraceae bacterium]|nr:glucosyltransferase domain-containing protein [Lachnospiraceae bacterium]
MRSGFNADTLLHMVVEDADVETRITHGRYLIALIDNMLLNLGIRTTDNIAITMFLTLGILAIVMLIVQKVIVDRMEIEGFYRYVTILAIDFWALNVLFSEILMFSEFCIYSALAYLLGALAVLFYTKSKYIFAVLFLILGVCTYQYVVVFSAMLISFYICVENECKISKRIVLEEVACVLTCVGIGFANLVSTKILCEMKIISEVGKKAGSGDLMYKFSKVFDSFVMIMKHSYSMIPGNWIPAAIWMLIIATICVGLVKKNEAYKIVYIFLIIVVSFSLMYIIPLSGENFFFPPRMAFTYYFLLGFLVSYGIAELNSKFREILVILFSIFIIINLLCVQRINGNRYVSNKLDEVYVKMIDSKINMYEEETGKNVTKIAIGYDEYAPFHYSEVDMSYEQINESAAYSAVNSLMKIFTDRNFDRTKMEPEVFDKYFKGKDWNSFNIDEQVIVVGDTVYWCLY